MTGDIFQNVCILGHPGLTCPRSKFYEVICPTAHLENCPTLLTAPSDRFPEPEHEKSCLDSFVIALQY